MEKTIENIDCIKDKKEKSLILIKDCVLVNCLKGIAIISIKTKEIIQYIEKWENLATKKIYKSTDDYIYISNSSNDLLNFEFVEYNLKLIEKIKVRDTDGEIRKSYDSYGDIFYGNHNNEDDIHLINYNIIINNDSLLIFDDSIYFANFDK